VRGGLQSIVDTNIQLNSLRGSMHRETVKLGNAAANPAKEQKKKKWAEAAEAAEAAEEE